MSEDYLMKCDDYLHMWRAVLTYYARLNQWRDGYPHEEAVLHGIADCWAELAEMGAER